MKIPRSFCLHGKTYRVHIVAHSKWKEPDAVAFFRSTDCTIHIDGELEDERRGHAFCHELAHAILHAMGETRLYENEKFIDLLGALLHQAWTSFK